ncbi:ribosomal L15-domain-containing protein [Aspergillus lucknowensis]|uniref:Ribosomal protein L15 n=1 Tax=Aspergillus lucknowensis TaxID=176173 RepID=A0ABR4LWF4_9EURO
MAASSSKQSSASQTPVHNASARLEKTHPGIRRSTPDSEALASSDDDGEHPLPGPSTTTAPAQKPARRTSWLNEIPASMPRKASLSGPLSSGASNPTSPATDQSGWQTNTSPGLNSSITWNNVGGTAFPWGTGIWNTDSRKEPPSRLSEIVPSPTTSIPPASGGYLTEELLSPTTRTAPGDSAIPFSIPLHPTPKTYRSQSYSVGQLDPEVLNPATSKSTTAYPGSRPRNGAQYSALQHRSSRPSLLGELGHDPATLGRVREDEDDDAESPNGSDGSYGNYAATQARTIEQLSRENALLRQAAGQMDSPFRDRTMSSSSAASGYAVGSGIRNIHPIRGSVPEEADLAVEDLDEVGNIPGYNDIYNNPRRRFSEHSTNLEKQFPAFTPLENRALENVRKAHWQTSLGFGSLGDIPQSRRHSFAEIPIRHTSVSGESQGANTSRAGLGDQEENYANIGEGPIPNAPGPNREYPRFYMAPRPEEHDLETEYLRARRFAESYFGRDPHLRAAADTQPPIAPSLHQAYTSYGRHQPQIHPHPNQLLYIVTFKCHRADVFFIQKDTGLQVKTGDLVIVEADRGTDLGTILHANVTLQEARELKQKYAEEHYKWLMMFSRQGQNGTANAVGSPGSVTGLSNRSAIGGMGPHGSHGMQDSAGEIKPKLIKRLAQNHEILSLREKEANEAKAKRVCQQKVAEHRLNMEILDAEFQMDWKKLTFYYFADSYINFNSLVTDLFKVYKTRIWMSAINPASFVTPPTAGLSSPNPLGYGQDTQGDRSHQRDPRAYGQSRDGLDAGRDGTGSQMGLLRSRYGDSYQQFGHPRQPEAGLGGLGSIDPFASYSSNTYGQLEPGYTDYTASPGGSNGPPGMNTAPGEWVRQRRRQADDLQSRQGMLNQCMGALKYVEEIQKKKQSDVIRFLLRVRCWELRQLNAIHRASRPSRPDKARRLGYKAKQGYVIYRVRVRRGGRKRPVPKGATYGKPTNMGVNQLKYQRALRATAEERVGRRCANLRVLNSYWINQDSTYKYFEVILVDPQHKAIRRDARINWIANPVHKHREARGLTATGKKSRGINKGHRYNNTTAGRRHTWKRQNTQSYWRYR